MIFDNTRSAAGQTAKKDDKRVKTAIIGVGGGGSNAVDNMINAGVKVDMFMAINTDYQALRVSKAEKRIQIGSGLTDGFGAGANFEVGRQAAEACKNTLSMLIKDMNLVFITAGMGGGTGTGAAPVIAEIAHELGILTIAFVTTPFKFEGAVRERNAQIGIANLRKFVDAIIVIPNERLASVAKDMNMTTQSAFQYADDVLRQGVQATTDLIANPGRVNVDFADIRTILTKGGDTIMGIGRAGGSNRAIEAVKKAVNNAVLGTSIEGATRAIINVEGKEVKMDEIANAVELIRGVCAKDANIIFGTAFVPELKDEIQVTVIATGFNKQGVENPASAQETPSPFQSAPTQQAVDRQPQVPQQPVPPRQPLLFDEPQQPIRENQPVRQQPVQETPKPRPNPNNGRIDIDDPSELSWWERINRRR